jgi:hypothetical protein
VDDARVGPVKDEPVRELAAAALLLLALVIGALAPKIWADETESRTLASATPALSSAARTLPSWRGRDGGAGFVVCGSSDTWRRPSVAEENAHLAADPRYRDQRVDDASVAARTFAASVLLYDGAGNSSRAGLATLSGLWADPGIGGRGCTSVEPQVWLFGYTPVSFSGSPGVAELRVREAPGYRMVVVTGAIGTDLVVVGESGKIAAFETKAWLGPTPTPAPKRTATPTEMPSPTSTFPITDRPLEIPLPGCEISPQQRHTDGQGAVWTVQCGSARANLAISVAATRQGWSHLAGPPIGVGIQTYAKGKLSMQLAYRLDGPAYSDPVIVVQYTRPFAQGGDTSDLPPLAYLRVPTGFDLPTDCVWKANPAGFTGDGAYEIAFACQGLPAAEIRGAFHRQLLAQGWRAENGGFGFTNYAKDDLRLLVNFVNGMAEPSETPWVVESLCCFGP